MTTHTICAGCDLDVDQCRCDDPAASQRAAEIGRTLFAAADTLTVLVALQLQGFAANPSIGMHHDPHELAGLSLRRAKAALLELSA